MKTALTTLKDIRERRQRASEAVFIDALKDHHRAEQKLRALDQAFKDATLVRSKIEQDFIKHTSQDLSLSSLLCHVNFFKKAIVEENRLKLTSTSQKEQVGLAKNRVDEAQKLLLKAQMDFMMTKKLLSKLLAMDLKIAQSKDDAENDEQNGTRFCLKRP